MIRIRALVAALAIAVPIPVVIAGCGGGGGGSSEDPQQVIDQTFNNPTKVASGNLGISLSGSASGSQGGNLDATISGPFQGDANDPTAFPQFDLSAKVGASGAGQSFSFDGSLIATKDNAYVVYQNQAYEVGTTLFKQFAQAYQQSAQQAQSQGGGQSTGSFLKRFGVDPKTWLTNLSNEGEEDVEGTTTIHIHGDANIDQIVSDFGKIAQGLPGGSAQQVTPAQLDQVKSAIKDASLDVYSGKDDQLLHKLSLNLTIAPPASAGAPVSSVKVSFSVTLSDINQTQTISAPSGAKPIAGLLSQLGVGGLPLGSLGGASGGGSGLGGGSAGGGGGPSNAYLKCVQRATTPDAINACASKIQ